MHPFLPVFTFTSMTPFFFQFNGALTDFLGKIKLTRSKTSLEVESEVAQSCPTLCNPMDCSLPGSSIHGILQARVLDWVAISFSRGSSPPSDRTHISCITGGFFTAEPVLGSPLILVQLKKILWVLATFSKSNPA